jgi:ABC-2 type transport system permease protein
MRNTAIQPNPLRWLREDTRIVWTLFAKDVLEALKNKNTITVIITSLIMVFFYRWLPTLYSQEDIPNLLIYDGGSSRLVPLLENSRNIKLYTYPTEEKMKQTLANGEVPELGLVIPNGFDQAIQAGETRELQGYVLRWVNEKDAEAIRHTVETEIRTLLGRPVPVVLAGNRVDLLPESSGLGETASFGLAYVLIMIGVILIPHLMLDEKENRTLDALTVSPASAGHIVAGKALAGLFYCSLGGITALAINRILVVHWWLALLTVLLGSLFTVSLGLLLGIKIDSRAQLSLWAWIILLPLIIPIVFSLLHGLIPDVWVRIFSLVPSSVILQLSRTSFANPIPIGKTLLQLAWVAVAAGAGLVGSAWVLRRRDRETEIFTGSLWQSQANTIGEESQNFFTLLKEKIARLHQPQNKDERRSSAAAVTEIRGPGLRSSLSMIYAIAAKDLLEALKNRLILSILLGSSFILLTGAALPLLLSSKNLPRMVVYDQGHSTLLRGLATRNDFHLAIVDSREEMETALSSSQYLTLGLILPGDFDQRVGSGQLIELQTSYPHWADPELLSQRAAFFEEKLSQASWTKVHLDLAGHSVYPPVDLVGQPLLLLLNLIAVILMIGFALVPLLMIEEKEAQTLKVLLVSPASLTQVVVGKALVGLFYSMLPVLVVMIVYHYLFVHWEVAFLAFFLTASLAVITGLLLGILTDTPTSASLWCSLLLLVTIGSAWLKTVTGQHLSSVIQSALDWLPGSNMLQLFSLSQAGEVPPSLLWRDVGALLAAIAATLVLLAWRLRQMEG